MTITDKKKKLRKQMLLQRAKLDQQKKTKYDHWVCQSLWETIEDKGVKNIHCYLPMGTEINISPLIEKMLKENQIIKNNLEKIISRINELSDMNLGGVQNGQ